MHHWFYCVVSCSLVGLENALQIATAVEKIRHEIHISKERQTKIFLNKVE